MRGLSENPNCYKGASENQLSGAHQEKFSTSTFGRGSLGSLWKSTFWSRPRETFNINFWEGAVSLGSLGKLLMICHRPPTRTKLTNHHQFLGIGSRHTNIEITCSARTRDLVKLDITQTDTVNSPEGCSDIRRAPCVRFQHLGSKEVFGRQWMKTKLTSSMSEQSLRQSRAWCSSESALLSTWDWSW